MYLFTSNKLWKYDLSKFIVLLINLIFEIILFGSGFIVMIAFSLERIAFRALKVLSESNTLFDDNSLGNSIFQPFFVASSFAV
jgi:hypothetical protein